MSEITLWVIAYFMTGLVIMTYYAIFVKLTKAAKKDHTIFITIMWPVAIVIAIYYAFVDNLSSL